MTGRCKLLIGNVEEALQSLPSDSVRCCVTSPPYWGLRDYGFPGQIGLEATPERWAERLVAVFREVRRVLTPDGTLWLNLGDSYATTGGSRAYGSSDEAIGRGPAVPGNRKPAAGFKSKDLIGQPWLLAFALRADGWFLRADIIWHKPNPMPESVNDRPTRAHEYIFLLSRSARYFYDAAATQEECSPNTHARMSQDLEHQEGSRRANGGSRADRPMKAVTRPSPKASTVDMASPLRPRANPDTHAAIALRFPKRNMRSVWKIGTRPYKGAHFATFPEALARRCIMAGSAKGDTVLDPFGGSGTTGAVATALGRNAIHIDGQPDYTALAMHRIGPMFCDREVLP